MHISIHAPRAGCDRFKEGGAHGMDHFNPRTPCGVRLCGRRCRMRGCISIHAPRAGCDPCGCSGQTSAFISIHAPRAGCDAIAISECRACWISIHAPRAGCDTKAIGEIKVEGKISIHAPRAGCDGKFDGFTRPNLRKRYKKVSVQPKKRAKKKIKEMLCSHSHIFGWISGAKVPEFPAR